MKYNEKQKKYLAFVAVGIIILIICIIGYKFDLSKSNVNSNATGETATEETATGETSLNDIELFKEAYEELALNEDGTYKDVDITKAVILPENYKNIVVPSSEIDGISQTVDENLDYLRVKYGELEAPENDRDTVAYGDVISVAYTATVNGDTFYLADGTESKGTTENYIVGSGLLFDGFDDKLLNQKANNEIEASVTIKDGNYDSSKEVSVAGETAEITFTVTSIQYPVLTNDVVKEFFDGIPDKNGNAITTIDEAAGYFNDSIEESVKASYVQQYLIDNSTIDQDTVAKIENEKKNFIDKYYAIATKLDGYETVDEYAKSLEYDTYEALYTANADSIRTDAVADLICQAVAYANNIQPEESDIESFYGNTSIEEIKKQLPLTYAIHETANSMAAKIVVEGSDFSN